MRFKEVERLAADQGVELTKLKDSEIENLWQQAKRAAARRMS
jgi:hypothetical protein